MDVLMDSKWTNEPKSQDSEEPHFVNRTYAVDYCNKSVSQYTVCVCLCFGSYL